MDFEGTEFKCIFHHVNLNFKLHSYSKKPIWKKKILNLKIKTIKYKLIKYKTYVKQSFFCLLYAYSSKKNIPSS
jgi:hypothetical protein